MIKRHYNKFKDLGVRDYFKYLFSFMKDSDHNELVKKSGVAFIFKTLSVILAFVVTLYITRVYGAEVYGLYSLAMSVLFIICIFTVFGLDIVLLRFVASESKRIIKSIYLKSLGISFFLGIIFSILLYIFSPFLAVNVFENAALTSYLRIIAFMIIPFSFLVLNSESLRGMKDIFRYALVYRNGFLFYVFVLVGLFLYNVKIAIIFGIVCVMVISFFLWFKKSNILRYKVKNFKIKKILSIAFPLMLGASMLIIINKIDTVMLGYFLDAAKVGIYSVALRIGSLITFILYAINSIAAPKFSDFYKNRDFKSMKKLAKISTKIIFLLTLPLFLIIILFPKFILSFFGVEFSVAWLTLIVIAIGQLFNAISGPVIYILNMTDKQKDFRNIIAVSVLINVILNAVFIPLFGIIGAAIASTICYISWNLAMQIKIKQYYGFYVLFFIQE